MQAELRIPYETDVLNTEDSNSYSSTLHKIWLYGMLLSFFWELPVLKISSMNRINPRFYDIFFLFGLLLFGGKLFLPIKNSIYNSWKNIVIWFSVCAVFFALILPFSISQFSLLCAVRYIQGLIVIKMVLLSRLDIEKILIECCLIGLSIIAVYCFFERSTDTLREIEIAEGKVVMSYGNILLGPLSFSYFHLGQLLPLAAAVIYSYVLWNKKHLYIIVFTTLLCWPVFWCGSRTALALMLVVMSLTAVKSIKINQMNLIWLVVLFLIGVAAISFYFPHLFEEATTLNRYQEMEQRDTDSIEARFRIWETLLNLDRYDYWYFIPFFGAGFNVAPVDGYCRIGYGIHCLLVYPLEQAGLFGEILFIIFSFRLLKRSWKTSKENCFAFAALIYFTAQLLCGLMGAHSFWREFETGNVNTLMLIVFCLAEYKVANREEQDENTADQ